MTIYITEGIRENTGVRVLQELKQASNYKNIDIYLATDGGSMKTMFLIGDEIERLQENGTNFTFYISGHVMSAGVYLLSLADRIVHRKNVMLMVHKPFLNETWGNSNKLAAEIQCLEYHEDIYYNKIKKFLNSEQMQNYHQGLDVYFTYEGVNNDSKKK